MQGEEEQRDAFESSEEDGIDQQNIDEVDFSIVTSSMEPIEDLSGHDNASAHIDRIRTCRTSFYRSEWQRYAGTYKTYTGDGQLKTC